MSLNDRSMVSCILSCLLVHGRAYLLFQLVTKVKWPILNGVAEAQLNLSRRQASCRAVCSLSGFPCSERALDGLAQFTPNTVKVARCGALVDAVQTANLRERKPFDVVERKEQAVGWCKPRESQRNGAPKVWQKCLTIGVGIGIRGDRDGNRSRPGLSVCFVIERYGALGGSQGVYVALSQHGTQPRGEFAAAVVILEQRANFAIGTRFDAIQLRVKRIGKFPGTGFVAWRDDRPGSRVQHGTIAGHKLFPCRFGTPAQRTCQGQIFEMKATQKSFENLTCRRIRSKVTRGAAKKVSGELFAGYAPSSGA